MPGTDSLLLIAQRSAARHASGITSLGDLPPSLVLPILAKVPTPQQLALIESSSPQIIGHTDALWVAFMEKNIPKFSKAKPHRPADPKNWYRVYKKLKKQADAEEREAAGRLKAAYEGIATSREKELTKVTNVHQMPARRVAGSSAVNRAGWGPSSRGLTPAEKIKRQVNDAARAKMLRERNLAKLSGQQKAGTSAYKNPAKVSVAPRSMVEEIKKSRMSPPPAAGMVRAPIRRSSTNVASSAADQTRQSRPRPGDGYDLTQDREARLRAMQSRRPGDAAPPPTQQRTPATGTSDNNLSLEFLEDEDLFSASEGDDDDIEVPTITAKPDRSSPRPTPTTSTHPARPAAAPTLQQKRKAPPALFMASSSSAKRPRGKVWPAG
jgi:elongin-A